MSDFGETVDQMDVEAFLNIRNWLERAVEKQGAKIVGAGIGAGKADLEIELEGFPYLLTIKPRKLTPTSTE